MFVSISFLSKAAKILIVFKNVSLKEKITILCKKGWILQHPPGALSRGIQLLHLDQAFVEDFISKLANGHPCPFRHGQKSPLDIRMNLG